MAIRLAVLEVDGSRSKDASMRQLHLFFFANPASGVH